jgi:hypothetical protein
MIEDKATEKWKKRLTDMGLIVRGYLPAQQNTPEGQQMPAMGLLVRKAARNEHRPHH